MINCLSKQSKQVKVKFQFRSCRGSMLFLSLFLTAALLCPTIAFIARMVSLYGEQLRLQSMVDNAALQVAEDLSQVMIDDPQFGFVSITNMPPMSPATRSASGKAQPVTGYNTLVGTILLDSLLCQSAQSQVMTTLVQSDAAALNDTTTALNNALQSAVLKNSQSRPTDCFGMTVNAYDKGSQAFSRSIAASPLHDVITVKDFRVEMGTLSSGATGIAKPSTAGWSGQPNSYYRAYQPYDAAGLKLVFGAIGDHASLCASSDFAATRKDALSCAVRVTATCLFKDVFFANSCLKFLGGDCPISVCAVARPGAEPDIAPPGVLTVEFAQASVPSLSSLRSILASSELESAVAHPYAARKGNFPNDPYAEMVPIRQGEPDFDRTSKTRDAVAVCLYDWLRSQRCRPSLSTLNQLLDSDFHSLPTQLVTIFEVAPTGKLYQRYTAQNPFDPTTVSENQMMVECESSTTSSDTDGLRLMIRDEVHYLGTIRGGKDCGQPIAGDPVNWCDLPAYGEGRQKAFEAGKGSTYFSMLVSGNPSSRSDDKSAISDIGAVFKSLTQRELTNQPNPNFYSGGLSVDLIIGKK